MSDPLSQLRDVDSPQSRLAQAVATGAFTTLVAPRKLSSRALLSMHALSGLLGAVGGALVLGEKASVPARATVAVAGGATLFGLSALGTTADVKTEEWMRRKGIRHPRLWLGVVAAVVAWLTSAPKPAHESDPADELETDDDPHTDQIDEGVPGDQIDPAGRIDGVNPSR